MNKDKVFDAKRVKDELITWIREYFNANASPATKAVIGISGGKDSSIVAALCCEALGSERVYGVLMPQGGQEDIGVSYELCATLGIEYVEINIQMPVQNIYDEIEKSGLVLNSIATVNTPARVRMTTLYAISAVVGGRVANTSNLSEDWVGYATKYGDTAGDFSPLSHLTVTEIKAIGQELGLAAMFVEKTPIDGLSGKTDEDNLGFSYAVLDRYIREQVCEDEQVKERIDRLYRLNRHKLVLMPAFKPYLS
ncbi:MAG: NAD(+) synthase [Lachnospiraceae bacterium]|jgi:NAD+ synthase|nr:NAD(+) synthase [Lachnospiraceae bacterium]